jgi:hypothetical protein
MHPYTWGWRGLVPEDEPPTEGLRQFLERCEADEWRVVVFSTRARDAEGEVGIRDWLAKHDLAGFVEDVTATKPAAIAYIDDRGITFSGDWRTVYEDLTAMLRHGPWKAGAVVDDEIVTAQIPPAPDEPVWYDTVDRSIHVQVRHHSSTTGPDHTRAHCGVPMSRFDSLNPDTTTVCAECF